MSIATECVGLDIGQTGLKAVRFRRRLSGRETIDYFHHPLPFSRPEDREPAKRVQSLRGFLWQNGLYATDRLVTAIPCQDLFVRTLSFPFKDAEKLSQVVPFEVENLVPMPVDELAIGSVVLPPGLTSEGISRITKGSDVLVTAAPRDKVAEHLRFLAQADIEPARRALAALGYESPPFCEDVHHQVQLERLDALSPANGGAQARHAWDLHWCISAHPVFAGLLTYGELAEHSVPIPALGPHARAAGRVHALLLAAVHPVMHHRNTVRLIWLCDIDRLVRQAAADDLEQLAALAIEKKVAAVTAHSLRLSAETLGTPVPTAVLARLETVRDEASARYLTAGRQWLDEVADSLGALPAWSERARLLRQIAFPPAAYMRSRYERAGAGRTELSLLYARRLLDGGWRAVSGRK